MGTYQIAKTKSFERKYRKLSIEVKKEVDNAIITLMKGKPYPPGLRVSKMKGNTNVYESSPTMAIRMTFEFDNPNFIILRNVGEHDSTLKTP